MINNYVVYHLHTEDSLLDSCTNYKLYVDKAVELGQKAIAFTEHGNIYHNIAKKIYCEEKGIKYIHGVEIYLTETLNENIRDNYHTILLARNFKGVIEINNLIGLSTKEDHRYFKNRITFDEFLNVSNNVIKISACLQSPLNKFKNKIKRMKDNNEDVKTFMDKYIKIAKHYDYYEIQYHNNLEQIEYNQYLYKISQQYNKPLILGTDTHSLNSYKAECRVMLQYGKTDGVWGDSENKFDLTYKTYQELLNMCKEQNAFDINIYLEAINNTNIMANSIENYTLDKSIRYPIVSENDEQTLWQRVRSMYMDKVNKGIININDKRYIEQIKEEMRVFGKVGYYGFMLFESELMSWCRKNNIFIGYARGSVAGSTVAYIIDIIDVDPIKNNLVFSRFCNESREETGDIDTDVYDVDRPKVYEYIINTVGEDKTAFILACGTLAGKSVIDMLGKAFRQKYNNETQYTLKKIDEIKELWVANEKNAREEYSDLFYYFDGLVGCIISQSQHPAGIIATSVNLTDNYGCFYNKGTKILQIDMEECHDLSLGKYDILGLKNIGILAGTTKLANISLPYSNTINWEDKNVFQDILTSPIGIFQFESDFAFNSLKKMQPRSVAEICVVNACIRPSGESYRDSLLNRQFHHNPSKIIDDLLKDTYGNLCYQEQIIAFLQNICGLSGSEADNIRRAIGRKQVDRLQQALPSILEGYCNKSDKPRDIAQEEAKTFLKIIEDASSYSFGLNHSYAYSMITYACAYMRYYYPVEFCTAFLNCSKSDEDILNGTILAKQKGIKIVNPKFRKSLSKFSCSAENNIIYKGIGSIKNIGTECGSKLYTLKNNQYDTFFDLLNDIKQNSLSNKTELDILIKINFFSEFGDIHFLLKEAEMYDSMAKRKTLKKKECDDLDINYDVVRQCCSKETDKQFSDVNILEVLKKIVKNINYIPTTPLDKIQYELQLLGYTEIIDPQQEDNIYAVQSLEKNNYGTCFVTLYRCCDGLIINSIKVDKKQYNDNPLQVGDILRIVIKEKYKRIQKDGKWVEDRTMVEQILSSYFIMKRIQEE